MKGQINGVNPLKRSYALKALVETYRGRVPAPMAYFAQAERGQVEKATPNTPSLEPFKCPIWEPLAQIHSTWIDRLLQKESPEKQLLMQQALQGNLLPSLRAFLLKDLYLHLGLDKALPPSFLPGSPMNALLSFSKDQLVRLTAYLGLYDLSLELRKVIDKEIFTQIERSLSKGQVRYLEMAMREADPLPEEALGMQEWLKNPQRLVHLLQEKGLRRLGLALTGQEPSLLFYLVHKLDLGRGTLVLEAAKGDVKPLLAERLQSQVLHVSRELNFLKEPA
ncbi:MAG: hypothetical protein JSR80_06715 [Verrucomicrobia bacterium]|nr:hypothetical protein [Verrucomicrobiota bacterium]